MDRPHLNNIQRILSTEVSLFTNGKQAEQGPMEMEATKPMVTLPLREISMAIYYLVSKRSRDPSEGSSVHTPPAVEANINVHVNSYITFRTSRQILFPSRHSISEHRGGPTGGCIASTYGTLVHALSTDKSKSILISRCCRLGHGLQSSLIQVKKSWSSLGTSLSSKCISLGTS